jgi:hypothetical protein
MPFVVRRADLKEFACVKGGLQQMKNEGVFESKTPLYGRFDSVFTIF